MNDDVPTPAWLMRCFDGWYDPCEIGATDGLTSEWLSPSYCNPPYSDPAPWVEKAISESMRGVYVVMLVRVDTSTKWWMRLVEYGARFAFFLGRIKFIGQGSPNFASALVFLSGGRI